MSLVVRPRFCGERAVNLRGRRHRVPRAWKREEDTISGPVDLCTAVRA